MDFKGWGHTRDRKFDLEVTEGLLFGLRRILTSFGRGGSVQGFGETIIGRHQPESEDPVFVWFLQSPNPYCRVFVGVLVVPVKKMVGGIVEPVGVLVGVFGYSTECD